MRFSHIFVGALLPLAVVTTPAAGDAKIPFKQPLMLTERDLAGMALVPRQDLTDLLGGLADTLASLKQFLSADFLNDVHTVVTKLADLLGDPFVNQTRGIIDTAGGLLSEISPLLETIGKLDLNGLIGALTGLLTTDNIKSIGDILKQGHNLLTEKFVNQTKTLIGDVQPLVSAVAQFITVLITAILGG